MRELGLHGEARGNLDAHLQKLVAAGELVQLNSDRYALPQPAAHKNDKNLVVGRLTMHRDGFGFVIPDASSLSPSLKSRLVGDIFIAPHAIGNAMHGDRVLVDIVATRPDGRAEGRIVRPVVRAHPTVVGIFHYGDPPQLRKADRQQDHDGCRNSSRRRASGSRGAPSNPRPGSKIIGKSRRTPALRSVDRVSATKPRATQTRMILKA